MPTDDDSVFAVADFDTFPVIVRLEASAAAPRASAALAACAWTGLVTRCHSPATLLARARDFYRLQPGTRAVFIDRLTGAALDPWLPLGVQAEAFSRAVAPPPLPPAAATAADAEGPAPPPACLPWALTLALLDPAASPPPPAMLLVEPPSGSREHERNAFFQTIKQGLTLRFGSVRGLLDLHVCDQDAIFEAFLRGDQSGYAALKRRLLATAVGYDAAAQEGLLLSASRLEATTVLTGDMSLLSASRARERALPLRVVLPAPLLAALRGAATEATARAAASGSGGDGSGGGEAASATAGAASLPVFSRGDASLLADEAALSKLFRGEGGGGGSAAAAASGEATPRDSARLGSSTVSLAALPGSAQSLGLTALQRAVPLPSSGEGPGALAPWPVTCLRDCVHRLLAGGAGAAPAAVAAIAQAFAGTGDASAPAETPQEAGNGAELPPTAAAASLPMSPRLVALVHGMDLEDGLGDFELTHAARSLLSFDGWLYVVVRAREA